MANESVERTFITSDDAIETLVIAIIQRAADDYRSLGRMLHSSTSQVEKRHIEENMKSISRFFLGDWYAALTGLENGTVILGMLDNEVLKDV